jgi:hypothetical protein
MSRFALVLAAAALVPITAASGEDHATHARYSASVASYKPLQGFSHVVGSRHFVGYFVSAKNGCAVTVINATVADDHVLETPRRQKLDIPAGGGAEVKADHGRALAIDCAADAHEISVVAVEPRVAESTSR